MGIWYHVSEPNAYLVITGAGVNKVMIKKKALVYPFQKVTKIRITPFDFSMSLQAMTIEKLKFSLPAVFTIGPADNLEALEKYAVLLTGGEAEGRPKAADAKGNVAVSAGHVQDIVKGIIEGETRSIVSTMTMEELFRERKIFKDKVIQQVQSELDQFGLCIYNANVKELQDTPGSEYFAVLSRKAHEGALNQAKVDVADARMKGEVGEAEKQGKTKQEVAKIHAATAVLETERKGEKAAADAKLTNKEIEIEKSLNIARINAQREAERRDAELNTEVEKKKALMELERLRATTVTEAKIAKESSQEKADAQLYTQEKAAEGRKFSETQDADAAAYRLTKDAEAQFLAKEREAEAAFYTSKRAAEAEYFKKEREAQATLVTQQREAEGLSAMAKAYGDMANVLGGPQGLMQYLMLQNNTYERLAKANALAINGMQPKINVWNTGASGENGAMDSMAPIRNLFQSLPPLLSTIQDQTGMQPPAWLAQMPQEQEQEHAYSAKKRMELRNGSDA
ncbi:flotillin domain-containing protein [Pleomassaria siparia CBS 279.74]|uniref:Flotillin domain-containing protein n=1 Tax=Pleomassaria siparia CBS 279.74 TaxID=1314801 RepID=A0A6G1KG35_9PLEO|nr:flotillin domain-containing protein [Pleomassaria siparia CBS 279.74]